MKCPHGVDELQLINLIEGELDKQEKDALLSHLDRCDICANNYNSLSRTLEMLSYSGNNSNDFLDPGESFWSENRRVIASRTYLKDNVVSISSAWKRIRKSQALKISLAAAAVMLITLGIFNYQTGVNNPDINSKVTVEKVDEAGLSADQYALLDSLRILQQKITDYELAASTLEALGDYVYSVDSSLPLLDENAATGSSIYSSMMDLNEDELEIVAYALASNDF